MMLGAAVSGVGWVDPPLDARHLHLAGRGDGGRRTRRRHVPQELQGQNWSPWPERCVSDPGAADYRLRSDLRRAHCSGRPVEECLPGCCSVSWPGTCGVAQE